MNRRGFLQRLGAAVAGYALSGQLSGLIPKPPQRPDLAFAPDAIARAMDPISIRFVRQFDTASARTVNRVDVIYGIGTLRPDFAVRVVGQRRWWQLW